MMEYQYYKIKQDRQEYLGVKYFRVAHDTDSVVSVVRVPGDMRRGRPNSIGMFYISKQSFASNLFAYVEPCKEAEYKKAFQAVYKMLQ